MAAPRVFVSSTFYDLRYIRENLQFLITSLGYEPVLSEQGNVYYDPDSNVQDAAVAEVASCQMLVLIIGGRFGQPFKGEEGRSIVNAEYDMATEAKIPIFALVERDVAAQYDVYKQNKASADVDETRIGYPAVDSWRVFEFIERVRKRAVNNALFPFDDFGDIQQYLKQQWASMMFSHLTQANEERRVSDTLAVLTEMGRKIEFLTEEVLRRVGDVYSSVDIEMYDAILQSDLAKGITDVPALPRAVLESSSMKELLKKADVEYLVSGIDEIPDLRTIPSSFRIVSQETFEEGEDDLVNLRLRLEQILENHGLSVNQYLNRYADDND